MADTISFGIKADDMTKQGFASVEGGLKRLGNLGNQAFRVARTGAIAFTGALAGAATATALLTKREAELIREIKLVADTTGVAAKQVSAWTEEFRRFSLEAEDVRDVLNELNIKQNDALMGAESVTEAFAVFGLSLQDIADMDANETLLAIADGFQTVEDHALAAWAADAIFGGDMAQKTIPILMQGRDALLENAAAAEQLGLIYDEKALASAERYNVAQTQLSQTLRGLGTTIATAAMPHITNLMKGFDALIKLGQNLIKLFPAMNSGAITFAQGFDKAFTNLPPAVQRTIAVLATQFATGLNQMLKSVWEFGGEVEKGIVDVVNQVINSVPGLAGVVGQATGSGRFSGAPPTVTLPSSVTDFLQATTGGESAFTTRGTGTGGQSYTFEAGSTYSHAAQATGLSVDQIRNIVGAPDRGIPIGTRFNYGAGSGSTRTTMYSPDRYMQLGLQGTQDPELMGLYNAYLQSLQYHPTIRHATDAGMIYGGQGGPGAGPPPSAWEQIQPHLPGIFLAGSATARLAWKGANFATFGAPNAAARFGSRIVRNTGRGITRASTGVFNRVRRAGQADDLTDVVTRIVRNTGMQADEAAMFARTGSRLGMNADEIVDFARITRNTGAGVDDLSPGARRTFTGAADDLSSILSRRTGFRTGRGLTDLATGARRTFAGGNADELFDLYSRRLLNTGAADDLSSILSRRTGFRTGRGLTDLATGARRTFAGGNADELFDLYSRRLLNTGAGVTDLSSGLRRTFNTGRNVGDAATLIRRALTQSPDVTRAGRAALRGSTGTFSAADYFATAARRGGGRLGQLLGGALDAIEPLMWLYYMSGSTELQNIPFAEGVTLHDLIVESIEGDAQGLVSSGFNFPGANPLPLPSFQHAYGGVNTPLNQALRQAESSSQIGGIFFNGRLPLNVRIPPQTRDVQRESPSAVTPQTQRMLDDYFANVQGFTDTGAPILVQNNINIQVDDVDDFTERLNDAIQSGAVELLVDAYTRERDARG